jgi:hypothetical protein
MSDQRADQIRHWLSVADDQDNDEKKLSARYTAAASARRWVLHRLGEDSDDVPDGWDQVRQLDDQADDYLDDDRQDEAMFRRAQANLLALRLFEDSDESQRSNGDDKKKKDDDDKKEKKDEDDKKDDDEDDKDDDKKDD